MKVTKLKSDTQPSHSKAWNLIGQLFWDIGHRSLREDKNIINLLLCDINPEKKCCIIGASTVPLIQEMLQLNFKISVLDFSRQMCKDLKKEIAPQKCDIKIFNIINKLPEKLYNSYHYIFADQLINCFRKEDIPLFFANISKLLITDGELRAIIKIGLYKIDEEIIEQGEKLKISNGFYDEKNQTINYSKAYHELSVLLENNIHKESLINWYFYRGEEMRFKINDINEAFINVKFKTADLKLLNLCL